MRLPGLTLIRASAKATRRQQLQYSLAVQASGSTIGLSTSHTQNPIHSKELK